MATVKKQGHNNGPSMHSGQSWRRHCWARARADLLPHLPIEILRTRVARAKEIGLDYTTYASVRAASGHDVVGFLFSSNALRSLKKSPTIPTDRAIKVSAIENCAQIALVSRPLNLAEFRQANPNLPVAVVDAPTAHANWSENGRAIQAVLQSARLPRDGVLLVGDTSLEQEWSVSGRLAGYVSADRYFPVTL